MKQLRYFREAAFHDEGDLGYHVCELCGLARDRGEFWVEWADVRYVLPALVVHYCEAHEYVPPDEFLAALSKCWAALGAEDSG